VSRAEKKRKAPEWNEKVENPSPFFFPPSRSRKRGGFFSSGHRQAVEAGRARFFLQGGKKCRRGPWAGRRFPPFSFFS